MKVERFNDSESCGMKTSFGTLKTRVLVLSFDAHGPDTDNPITRITEWCGDYGFDHSSLDIHYDYHARRLTISQVWWDRSERLQK